MRPFPCYRLTDAALDANASVLAVAVLSHSVAAQFTAPTIDVLRSSWAGRWLLPVERDLYIDLDKPLSHYGREMKAAA